MGRPGLLGTVARTAVVAGTASAVAGGVSRHASQRAEEQGQDAAAQQQQAAAQQVPPPAPAQDDTLAKIRELGEMRSQGLLTDEEFAAQKARILGS
jgi:Na+-translocating ferredoxin:NAD+ oxidoreductase RnfG subunit